MKIHLDWDPALLLRDASRQGGIYRVDLDALPTDPGIYVFGRTRGQSFEALYVGKANVIRWRIRNQLNNLRLMQHIRTARSGRRIVVPGVVLPRPGQSLDRILPIAERALIRYFLSEGHDLVNKQGTRLRNHEIISSGRQAQLSIPSIMYLER